jgi:hypothetical protein
MNQRGVAKLGLHLSTHSFGPIALAAAPPGSTPAHAEFTLTSSGGPFCVLGFYIDPVKSGGSPAGKVEISLSRINGSGVIHPGFEIAEGMGVRPQDLVVSYGSVMSSSFSIAFHLIQWPSSSGTGASFNIFGSVVFVADVAVTLTVS